MSRRRSGDPRFQHGSPIEADSRGVRDRTDLSGCVEATRLLDLDGKHIRGRVRGEIESASRSRQGLIRHDRHDKALGQTGHGAAQVSGYRLLHQVASSGFEKGDALGRCGLVPGLIDIDPHAGLIAEGGLYGAHMRRVSFDGALAYLELENPMPTAGQHGLRLGDVLSRIAACEGPGHRQVVPATASEELRHRQADALAHRVQEGGLDGALGEVITDDGAIDTLHILGRTGCLGLQKQGREIGVDGELDALWAFRSIAQAADGRRLANAFDPVRAPEAHQDQGLAIHGRHGQDVRPDRRQIHQEGIDRLDQRHVRAISQMLLRTR